jgi:penicillin-binding protein 1C
MLLLKKLAAVVAASFASFLFLLLLDALFPPKLPTDERRSATIVTDRNGQPLRAFADQNGVWRYPASANDVSPLYLQALLNYEDRRFYQHRGVNPFALMRAGGQFVYHRELVSGGSTLSMQVARILDPHPRTVVGKLEQMLRAVQLEWRYSKTEILELYLNYAPFGGPIEGVQAASFTYFGKEAGQLTHAEAALLAVLPQSPSRFRPDRYPERARQARDKVLDRLASYGVWSEQEVSEAKAENVRAQFNSQPKIAPLLARRLKREHPDKRLIQSSIDINLQRSMEALVKGYMQRFPEHTSAALLLIDNRNLGVLAYVGSADFDDAARFGHVDMIQAPRSPGSTLKPFLYGLAIDQGLIHEQSLLLDVPSDFGGYRPANFDQDFNGAVSARQALQRSLNVPAVQLMDALGPEQFYARMRSVGMSLQVPGSKANLSLILGGAGVSLEELTRSFAVFGRKGLTRNLILSSNDSAQEERRLLSEEAAWIISDGLAEVSLNRFARRGAIASSRERIAFKTGTSYGYRDAWVLGASEDISIGVWVGRPDGTALQDNYGRHTAVPLLRLALKALPKSQLKLPKKPHSISKEVVCWPLGTLKTLQEDHWCMREKLAWLIEGQAPVNSLRDPLDAYWSGSLVKLRLDEQGRMISGDCEIDVETHRSVALWPSSLEIWLPNKWRRESLLPPSAPGCSAPASLQKLNIEGINHKSSLRPMPGQDTLPTIPLSVSGHSGETHWFLNQRWLQSGEQIELSELTKGAYTLNVIDANGNMGEIRFNVER